MDNDTKGTVEAALPPPVVSSSTSAPLTTNEVQQQQQLQQNPPAGFYMAPGMHMAFSPGMAFPMMMPIPPGGLHPHHPAALMASGGAMPAVAGSGGGRKKKNQQQLLDPHNSAFTNSNNNGSSGGAGGGAGRMKKAPDAPKRFKSAFIIFSAEKHREIKAAHAVEGRIEKTTNIAKKVSEAWKQLTPDERKVWDDLAARDKARFDMEKQLYQGPWKIAANKRTPKDPSAPKRPSSAFLAFSNQRRAQLKKNHPAATNADLSKMLSNTWKECDEVTKREYTEKEATLRAKYKIDMAEWRRRVAEEKREARTAREANAMQLVDMKASGADVMMKADGAGGTAMMYPFMVPANAAAGAAAGSGVKGEDGATQMQYNPAMMQYGMQPAAMLSQYLATTQQYNASGGAQQQENTFGLYGPGVPDQGTQGDTPLAVSGDFAGFGSKGSGDTAEETVETSI